MPEIAAVGAREPVSTRERERVYEGMETRRRGSRPEFLHEGYDRSDSAPMVVRGRRVSPSPTRIVVGESPDNLTVVGEGLRTRRGEERPRSEEGSEEIRREFPLPRDQRPRSIPPRPGSPMRTRSQSPVKYTVHTRTRHFREVDEVVWDLSRTKDLTMHLELDITEDLEPDLDEFCRLARLGNFLQAKQFFRDNLEQHMDDPYVFVQYAQMLMEMGDYHSVNALEVPYSLEESENHLLQKNWKLIKSLTILHTEGLSSDDELRSAAEAGSAINITSVRLSVRERVRIKEIYETKAKLDNERSVDISSVNIDDKSPLGSTECQILNLSLRLLLSVDQPYEPTVETSVWRTIYEEILRHGRIWDFRDIFTGAVHYYGQERACEKFFEISEIPLNRIILDWSTTTYDESTNLALLDILVYLALIRNLSPKTIARTRHLVDQAGVLASNIVYHQPNNLKSRQYIRWLLAKVAVTSYRDVFSSGQLSDLPGLFLSNDRYGSFLQNSAIVELPIYVPVVLEAPDWHLLCRPCKSSETLQMVLKAARQLGDLETEILCLIQMIVHSSEPAELFDELIMLQKTVQKDISVWLTTCLSKYIICRDKKSRDALRVEILSIGDDVSVNPELVWAKKMILRALAHSKREANLRLDEAKNLLHGLPSRSRNILDFMERNKLTKAEDVKPFGPAAPWPPTPTPTPRSPMSPLVPPISKDKFDYRGPPSLVAEFPARAYSERKEDKKQPQPATGEPSKRKALDLLPEKEDSDSVPFEEGSTSGPKAADPPYVVRSGLARKTNSAQTYMRGEDMADPGAVKPTTERDNEQNGNRHTPDLNREYNLNAAALGTDQYKKRKERMEAAERERERRRYEEEGSPAEIYDDPYGYPKDYSPSPPPHAPGGPYYPESNQFPPPPPLPTNSFTQSALNLQVAASIPPYNPADYVGKSSRRGERSGRPLETGDNASATKGPRASSADAVLSSVESNASLKVKEHKVSNPRRPQAVTVSSAKEEGD